MPALATTFLAMFAISGGVDESADPLRFTENKGQWDQSVRFLARTSGLNLWVTDGGVTYDFYREKQSANRLKALLLLEKSDYHRQGHVVKVSFDGASTSSRASGQGRLGGVQHYLKEGANARFVSAYRSARVQGLYEGIDMALYQDSATGGPRYDLVLAPGADVSSIRMRYEGVARLRVTEKGEVAYDTSLGRVVEKGLFAYQVGEDGSKREVSATPRVKDGVVTYHVPNYDRTRPLVIDPLVYSTYVGGDEADNMARLALDAAGNRYLVGASESVDYPITPGAYDSWTQNRDAVVTKLSSTGALDWSTFVGGSQSEAFADVAIDAQNRPVVGGYTESPNFPMVNAIDPIGKGGPAGLAYDGIVARLASNGASLVFSTHYASSGTDVVYGVDLDATGRIFVCGAAGASDLPITPDAFQRRLGGGTLDGFAASFTADGSALRYGTFVGGEEEDVFTSVKVNDTGRAAMSGYSRSNGFPTQFAFQPKRAGGTDGIITVLDSLGRNLLFSSYFGGSGNENLYALTHNGSGTIYAVGDTSSNDLGATRTFGTPNMNDGVIISISPTWQLTAKTLLGGCQPYFGVDVAPDGKVIMVGYSFNSTVPPTSGAIQYVTDESSVFVARLSPSLNALSYFSYLGGAEDDYGYDVEAGANNDAHILGFTHSRDFPTTTTAFDKLAGLEEGFFAYVKFTQNPVSIDPVDIDSDDTEANITLRIPTPIAGDTTIALSGGGGVLVLPSTATIPATSTSVTIAVPLFYDAFDSGRVVRFAAKRGTFTAQQVMLVP